MDTAKSTMSPTRCRFSHVLIATALGFCLNPHNALAGGYEYGTDNGALSVARGGASTALASNPNALYTNVAAFADNAARLELHLSANLGMRHLWFRREHEGARAIEDQTPLAPAPSFTVAVSVAEGMTIALGILSPAAVGFGSFDEGTEDFPGAGRYDLTAMQFVFLWPTLAFALEVPGLRNLRIGAAFQSGFVHITQSTYAAMFGPDNPSQDIRADLDLWDPFVPAGMLGALLRIWRLEMGFQVRVSASIEAEGKTTPVIQPLREDGGDVRPAVDASVRAPWPTAAVRFGIRYAHPRADAELEEGPPWLTERFDVELDFVYENNARVDRFEVTFHEPVQLETYSLALPMLPLDHNWQDTVALRLGGSAHVLEGKLSIHLGGFWERAAVPQEYTRLDFASWNRFGLGLGLTARFFWFEVTAAYQHIFMPDRTISLEQGKVVALRAAEEGGVFETPAVNAGDFRGGYDIFSLSLSLRI